MIDPISNSMDQEQEEPEILPLFCAKTTDKRTGQTLYINFKSSDAIQEPELDISEEQLVQEICNPSPRIEQFKVPLKMSQIFWRDINNSEDNRRDYVVDVELNDKFALRRVIASEIIRHYVVTVTMVSIEDKFNQASATKLAHQYIGHKLELDQANYEILDSKQQIERSNEPVNNRILLVENPSTSKEKVPSDSKASPGTADDLIEPDFDVYLRPASKLLTCSIQTDTCPDSISFNDDRIIVELGEKTLMDVYLPVNIDLTVPAKYKFDDRRCLFRVVFKLAE